MKFTINSNSLELFIPGLSTFTDSTGSVVYLEQCQKSGNWTLYVWSDVTQENPTHTIDLSKAQELK